jgi:hypothetical protein
MTKQELHLAFIETTFRVLKSDIFTNNSDLQIDEEINMVATSYIRMGIYLDF